MYCWIYVYVWEWGVGVGRAVVPRLELMRRIVRSERVPLLVEMIRQTDAVEPLLQSLALALRPKLQAAQKIVALAQILIPYGQYEHLLVQIMRTRLERELLVVDGIQCAPFDRCLVLFVLVRIRFQLPANGSEM